MGISRGLRDFQGAVGAVGNLVLVFHRIHGPAFSTAFRVLTHHVRSKPYRDGVVQVMVDRHGLSGQGVAPAALFDLPPTLADGHGIVLANHALGLNREDQSRSRRPVLRNAVPG